MHPRLSASRCRRWHVSLVIAEKSSDGDGEDQASLLETQIRKQVFINIEQRRRSRAWFATSPCDALFAVIS